jgi:hypothetical protein
MVASPRKHDLRAELSVCPPPSKKRRIAKKAVSFAEDLNTVRSRHVSDEDLNNSWLQPEEYEKIRENNRATLRAVKMIVGGNVSGLDVNKVCVRGLEQVICMVVLNTISRRKQREFVEKVLIQHRVEKDLGFSDPDSLRILSQALSKADWARALRTASIDAYC